ncbi:MarR family winged helix-turn-helix transcriptional regulator [Neobacillus muris]|uniref:MarR family winged helix-turn-helix transcriptional regulator n=1 Tax=Neobacillus muris TaxID=2941334 RepID=UPI00203B7D4F|nr:MarR family transcriptional regulator [Neobacillus muris]
MEKVIHSSIEEGQLDSRISRLVKVANRAIRKEMQDQLNSYGITPAQWSALGIIYKHPGLLASEVQTILLIERSSVTSLINGLVKRELVYREDHPDDGRYKRLYLTENGKELAHQTKHLARLIDEKIGSAYTSEEIQLLKKLLVKMVDKLEKE